MYKYLISVAFILSILFLQNGVNKAFAQEIVNCNPEDKAGECPRDIRFHRCQIVRDNGSVQTVVLGWCENTEEDINDDGEVEIVCKCNEEKSENDDINSNDENNDGQENHANLPDDGEQVIDNATDLDDSDDIEESNHDNRDNSNRNSGNAYGREKTKGRNH